MLRQADRIAEARLFPPRSLGAGQVALLFYLSESPDLRVRAFRDVKLAQDVFRELQDGNATVIPSAIWYTVPEEFLD
jgi:hypothetical protein